VEGGAEVVNVGVNGYGEGPGHVSLVETVYHLEFLYGFDTGINIKNLRRVCVLIADIMRQPLPKTAPLVGDNAFVYMFDKHHAFPQYPFMYTPIVPEAIGNRARPGFGEWAGPFGLKLHLNALGVSLPEDRIQPLLSALSEELRWRKRPLTDDEFRDLAATVSGDARQA